MFSVLDRYAPRKKTIMTKECYAVLSFFINKLVSGFNSAFIDTLSLLAK